MPGPLSETETRIIYPCMIVINDQVANALRTTDPENSRAISFCFIFRWSHLNMHYLITVQERYNKCGII